MNKLFGSDKLTELEKALIVISAHGIWIGHADGHRWIMCSEDEDYSFSEQLRKHGICLNNKIYGGVLEAVYVINEAWELIYGYGLVEDFNRTYEEKYDILGYSTDHNRIDKVAKGKGGLV